MKFVSARREHEYYCQEIFLVEMESVKPKIYAAVHSLQFHNSAAANRNRIACSTFVIRLAKISVLH